MITGFKYCLALSLILLMANSAFAETIKVRFVKGKVSYRSGKDPFETLKKDHKLNSNVVVKTGKGALVVLKSDRVTVKVGENSLVNLGTLFKKDNDEESRSLILNAGMVVIDFIKAVVPSRNKKQILKVKTPQAKFGIRGTRFFVFSSKGLNPATALSVKEGDVEVENFKDAKNLSVGADTGVLIDRQGNLGDAKSQPWSKRINWKIDPDKGDLAHSKGIIKSIENDPYILNSSRKVSNNLTNLLREECEKKGFSDACTWLALNGEADPAVQLMKSCLGFSGYGCYRLANMLYNDDSPRKRAFEDILVQIFTLKEIDKKLNAKSSILEKECAEGDPASCYYFGISSSKSGNYSKKVIYKSGYFESISQFLAHHCSKNLSDACAEFNRIAEDENLKKKSISAGENIVVTKEEYDRLDCSYANKPLIVKTNHDSDNTYCWMRIKCHPENNPPFSFEAACKAQNDKCPDTFTCFQDESVKVLD